MCAGKVCLPVVHQPPPTLEQVRPRVGGLDPVADDVRQRGLDDHPRVVIEAAQSRKLDRKPCGTAAMPKFPSRSDRHVPLTGLPQRFGNTSGSSSGGSAPSLPTPRWCDTVNVTVATLSSTRGPRQAWRPTRRRH